MSFKGIEKKWKEALFSILEKLEESQYRKLLFNLSEIPQGVKGDKVKEEMPQIIVQHIGTEKSINRIDQIMRMIPRMDDEVQDVLRPFVKKMKERRQQNKAVKKKPPPLTPSPTAAKRQKPAADGQMSCQPAKTDPVVPVKPKKEKTVKPDVSLNPAGSTKISEIGLAGPVKSKKKKTVKPDFYLEPAGSTKIFEIGLAGPVKPKKKKKVKSDVSLNPAGPTNISQIGLAGPVKSKKKKTVKPDFYLEPAGTSKIFEIGLAGPVKPKKKTVQTNVSLNPAGSTNISQNMTEKKTDIRAFVSVPELKATDGTQTAELGSDGQRQTDRDRESQVQSAAFQTGEAAAKTVSDFHLEEFNNFVQQSSFWPIDF